jgi:hypothetical protein
MERMQREKDEMQRTFQLEMERLQLEKMEMQRTFQLEMGEMQRTFHLEKMEMQRVRQQEEEKKLEGSSGTSWKEEGIECGSSAGPGLTGPGRGHSRLHGHRGQSGVPVTGGQGASPNVEIRDA